MPKSDRAQLRGTVLVANRGEIACRIIRACRLLGLQTIAIHSDADVGAPHVRMADVAVRIGPAQVAASYLNADAILQAAVDRGADAIHPGYGFLAENADFARRVEAYGLRWVGPTPESIRDMGDKECARRIASEFGVPVLPGSGRFGVGAGVYDTLADEAARVGYPLLIKASGGGGGIGMRRVDDVDLLAESVASAQSVAQKAFGDATVYLEHYVARARHIEVQVFGDGEGAAWSLFERECSVQRRFQKIVEESPAPGLAHALCQALCDAAVVLARGIRYRGAGTVEFLVDADTDRFYFLEMNTRIQVEHPVTEMVTGQDLVADQLRLAFNALPSPEPASRRGAAIECRIYAERPEKGFLPSPGLLEVCELPPDMPHVRIETGVESGMYITPYYDPMIAKLVVWADDRPTALQRLRKALTACRIQGVHTNLAFLQAIASHPDFAAGAVDTAFVQRALPDLLASSATV